MTGLDSREDRVVEVCVERCRADGVEQRIETLVRPDTRAGGNVHIHGIDETALTGAPRFADIAERVTALCQGGVLIAHAAAWDIAFLEAELGRCGRAERFPFFLDTLTLSRRAFALPSHALGSLATALELEQKRPHRAGDDVRVLRQVFARIVTALSPATPRDLWHVRVGERRARPEILSACVRAWESNAPVLLTYRPSKKPPNTVEAVVTRVRTDLDPPRVMGYALASRGRFDYRADRILSVSAPPATKRLETSQESDPKAT
jgi:DNA polymerase-3 subunit epsilon